MNHEKTHQTNPMAPWDPLDALLELHQVPRSQGLRVSRSQGLKVTGGLGVTGVTGMKVNVICEAVEVILRVQ